jgi:hypothetical protein
MSKEVIDYVSDMLGAVTKIGLGAMDEILHRIRRNLAETADAEMSALDQLQNILDAMRR